VAKKGHHQVTYEAAELAIGPGVSTLTAYFDTCRRKRNMLDYDIANVVSDTEATELLQKAQAFKRQVEEWIVNQYPSLVP
jgi:hypothetical protein